MSYHVGVTGTRSGMTSFQYNNVKAFLSEIVDVEEDCYLHYGDCIGVDTEVAKLAYVLGYKVICHPPEKTDLVGDFQNNHRKFNPKSYFQRNRDIVDCSDKLLVVPYQTERQDNGGTWYTFDYAIKNKANITVVYPDRVETYECGVLFTPSE